jgi:hypothetical protein
MGDDFSVGHDDFLNPRRSVSQPIDRTLPGGLARPVSYSRRHHAAGDHPRIDRSRLGVDRLSAESSKSIPHDCALMSVELADDGRQGVDRRIKSRSQIVVS